MSADGRQIQASSQSVSIPAVGSRMVTKGSAQAFINEHGASNTLLFVKLSENQQILSENFTAFVKPKHLELSSPGLEAATAMTGKTMAELTVSAQHPALCVVLDRVPG